jgi:hypothetical protein
MKKLVTLVALCSLCAVSALGQDSDGGPDSFGLYFEVDGSYVNQIDSVPPNTFLPTFIILSGITRPSVAGWEVNFEFTPGSGAVISTDFEGDATDFDPGSTYFIVGLGTPLPVPAEGSLVLAEMNFMFFSGITAWFGGPADPGSIPGVPVYANGDDLLDLAPCHFSTDADGMFIDDTGWTTIPLAVVNGEAPVAIEDVSWGNVKTIFR